MALVQSKSAQATSGSTINITGLTPTVAGNLLVLVAARIAGATDPTFTPPAGWVSIGTIQRDDGWNFTSGQVWYYPNNPGGITSVAISSTGSFANGSGNGGGYFLEFDGVGALDTHNEFVTTGFTTSPTVSTTPTTDGDLILGITLDDVGHAGGTITEPGSPWTGLAALYDVAGWLGIGVAYQTQTTHAAITYNPTFTASNDGILWIISFKAAGGGGTTLTASGAFSGAGTTAATPAATFSGTGGLGGSAALSPGLAALLGAASALSGAASLSGLGGIPYAGGAGLTGTGTASSSPSLLATLQASVIGTGSVGTAAGIRFAASAAFDAHATAFLSLGNVWMVTAGWGGSGASALDATLISSAVIIAASGSGGASAQAALLARFSSALSGSADVLSAAGILSITSAALSGSATTALSTALPIVLSLALSGSALSSAQAARLAGAAATWSASASASEPLPAVLFRLSANLSAGAVASAVASFLSSSFHSPTATAAFLVGPDATAVLLVGPAGVVAFLLNPDGTVSLL